MNRRNFIRLIGSLPFLGFLKPKSTKTNTGLINEALSRIGGTDEDDLSVKEILDDLPAYTIVNNTVCLIDDVGYGAWFSHDGINWEFFENRLLKTT